ncbi:MAG: hypothetical protein C5B51_16775 [Terriglobia bacterium]|nr:MAG: hypothetical protein C5B51_16775 [Terriglobia bacterium]
MPPYLAASGIRFNDCFFSEPIPLAEWIPPKCAGLFVILVSDANWAPRPFQPICFGEFGNNAQEVAPRNATTWQQGVPDKGLFVAVFPMPFSTTQQRLALRHDLVRGYNPVCQGRDYDPGPIGLSQKVDELERRHREQAAQVGQLVASLNRLFEPLPVRPARRMGFVPPAAPVGPETTGIGS